MNFENSEEIGYFIGDAVEITGVPQTTLRYWEKLGLVQPERSEGGTRLYSDHVLEEIRRLKFIIRGKHIKARDVAALRG